MIKELGKMPFPAVLPLAERMAKGSRADWADRLNISVHHMNRAFQSGTEDGNYFISFSKVPELCVYMHSPIILEWALQRYYHLASELDIPADATDCTRLLKDLAGLMHEVGQAAHKIEQAAEDDRLERGELRSIQKEVCDVLEKAINIQSGLNRTLRETDVEVPG